MKTVLACLFFVAAANAANFYQDGVIQLYPAPKGPIEDIINSTIEGLRPNIPDPITGALNITLPESIGDILSGNLDLEGINLTGLRGFQLQKLGVNILFMTVDLTVFFSKIQYNSQYTGDLMLQKETEIVGAGDADLGIEDVTIVAKFHLNLSPLSISNLEASLTLGALKADITGIMNDDAVSSQISDWLTNEGANWVNTHQEEIGAIIIPLIEELINSILGGIGG